ncbi:hypothetical protein ACWFMI_14915 [Nocardiopsis terrae]
MTIHYPGAPEWYIRAAREALNTVPPWIAMPSPGHSAEVLYDHEHGRINVAVAIDTGRTRYYDRPRPGRAREQWNTACDTAAQLLQEAGWTITLRTLAGFKATAPDTEPGPPVEIVRSPRLGDVGRSTLHINGHPELVAHLDARFDLMHSTGYTLTDDKGTTIGRYPTEHDAAHTWAIHCGFTPPTDITTY